MPEYLWIMRHGLAESQFDTDFNRALSAIGKAQAKSVAQQILDAGIFPTRVIASPFRRTQETAEQVIEVLNIEQGFETDEQFVHFADPELAASYLMALDERAVLVISHMPIVARMSRYIDPALTIGGFQTAQAVRFDNIEGQLKMSVNYLPENR